LAKLAPLAHVAFRLRASRRALAAPDFRDL